MSKNQVISVKILAEVQAGLTLRQAFDAVLGVGAFEKMAGDLYDQLRARAGL